MGQRESSSSPLGSVSSNSIVKAHESHLQVIRSAWFDIQKTFVTYEASEESSCRNSFPIQHPRVPRSVRDHFGSLLDNAVAEFLIRCAELDVQLRLRVPDGVAMEDLRRKLIELESRLYIAAALPSSIRLDLFGKATFLVKARLKREKFRPRDRTNSGPPMQSERMSSIERTYETFSPKPRSQSVSGQDADVPHDRGFYKITRLLDEIAATKSLPENHLNLSDLELTDSHLAMLCRRSRCNLQRICKVELSGNQLSDASRVAQLLAGSKHLACVSLRDNRFSTEGVIELAQAVLNKPSVLLVDVSRNGIDRNQLRHYLVLEHDRIQRNRPEREVDLFRAALGKIVIDKDTTCLHDLNVLANTC